MVLGGVSEQTRSCRGGFSQQTLTQHLRAKCREFLCEGVWAWNRKDKAHVEMELIRPVANNFVFGRSVSDLVLVDLVATRGVSILIEEHWAASYA